MKLKYSLFTTTSLVMALSLYAKTQDRWDGNHYQEHSHMQEESAFFLLDSITFKKTDNVLDIGCGDGKITAQISKIANLGQTVGLDISKNMIDHAKKTYANIPNLSFVQADATNFTLDNTFDYVISFYTIHWVKDLENCLKSIKNVLKPNGKVFIKIATMHKDCPIQKYFDRLDPQGKWSKAKQGRKNTFHGSKTAKEFQTSLENAEFLYNKVEIFNESFNFENFDAFVEWISAWGAYCVELPQDEAKLFFQEMIATIYASQNKKHEEPIVFTFPVLQAEAS